MFRIAYYHNITLLICLANILVCIIFALSSNSIQIGLIYFFICGVIIPGLAILITSSHSKEGNLIPPQIIFSIMYRNSFALTILIFMCFLNFHFLVIKFGDYGNILGIANNLSRARFSGEAEIFTGFGRVTNLFVNISIAYLAFTNSQKKNVLSRFLSIFLYFLIIFTIIVTASKAAVTFLMSALVLSYFKTYNRVIIKDGSTFLVFSFFILLAVFLAILIHFNRTNEGVDFMLIFYRIFTNYFFAPPGLFINYMNDFISFDSNLYFGQKTFMGIFKQFMEVAETRSVNSEYLFFGTQYSSNVYTGYRWLIEDYGILFSPIILLFMYIFFIHSAMIASRRSDIISLSMYYLLGMYILFLHFGSFYKFSGNIFSLIGILLIFLTTNLKIKWR